MKAESVKLLVESIRAIKIVNKLKRNFAFINCPDAYQRLSEYLEEQDSNE